MKTIKLTQNKETVVDDDWFETLATQYTWSASLVGRRWYAVTCSFGRKESMHQIIMENVPHEVSMEIDHINRDTLDNREENLRWVTRSQNAANGPLRIDNSSGEKGVYFDPRSPRPWYAQITVNGKRIYLGRYRTKEEAVNVRREATREHFPIPQQFQVSEEQKSQILYLASRPPESP